MYETPGARQPRHEGAPPWDPWERPPPGEDRAAGQPPPAARYPADEYPADEYPAAQYPAAQYPAAGEYLADGYPPDGHPPAGHPPAAERRLPAQHRLSPGRPGEHSRWHWLLLAAVVLPLLTPLYNRVQPQLLGLPFFYWGQIAFSGMATLVTAVIHLATKRRRP